MSDSELGKAIRLLKRALEQAFAWEIVSKNPAAHLKAPRYKPKETAYVRAEGVERYLEAVRGDPFEALFVVAALGGPRPAEMLALRWEDFGRTLVFPRPDDKEWPYGRHARLWRWQWLQDRAGLKRVHLYALRHTASMLLGRSGTDVKTTQVLMGHADARTTLKIGTRDVGRTYSLQVCGIGICTAGLR